MRVGSPQGGERIPTWGQVPVALQLQGQLAGATLRGRDLDPVPILNLEDLDPPAPVPGGDIPSCGSPGLRGPSLPGLAQHSDTALEGSKEPPQAVLHTVCDRGQ